MKTCLNKYCLHQIDDDATFCGRCIPPYNDINKVIDDIEKINEKLYDKIEWCKEHDFNYEASARERIYFHTRNIITKLRVELNPK